MALFSSLSLSSLLSHNVNRFGMSLSVEPGQTLIILSASWIIALFFSKFQLIRHMLVDSSYSQWLIQEMKKCYIKNIEEEKFLDQICMLRRFLSQWAISVSEIVSEFRDWLTIFTNKIKGKRKSFNIIWLSFPRRDK